MDRGYDSDRLRKQLRRRGIEPIVGRRKPPTQDGRALRRYKRRWIIERTFAWLGNYRRLIVRNDRSLTIYRWFFSYRVLHDRLTEGFEIASSHKGRSSSGAVEPKHSNPTPQGAPFILRRDDPSEGSLWEYMSKGTSNYLLGL